jgi:GTP cyclohydrolase I
MTSIEVGVRVPVTSLCPCSKEISDYGAHNQRGYVEIAVTSPWVDGSAPRIWFDDLIEVAEAAASAPVYPLLKRSDERFVTMQAYDNPAFVEDIVRDVLVSLKRDRRVARARVRVSNQESIHDHNAVARLQWERTGG